MKEKTLMNAFQLKESYKKGRRDFSNIRVVGADLSGSNWSGSIFRNSNFEGTSFSYCNLTDADFSGAQLNIGGFLRSNLTRASFKKAEISFISFENATFDNTNFQGSVLRYSIFFEANIGAADFTNASMLHVYMTIEETRNLTEAEVNNLFNLAFSELKKMNVHQSRFFGIKSYWDTMKDQHLTTLSSFYDMAFGKKSFPITSSYEKRGTKGATKYQPSGGVYAGQGGYKVKKSGKKKEINYEEG